MSYSLWSRGRLLGTSELDFVRCLALHRAGFLQPTEVGEQLLPDACGVSPAFMAMSRLARDTPGAGASLFEAMRGTTEYADLLAAQDRCAALELELRRADGTLVPTEWIDVKDGEFLLALAREAEEEMARQPDLPSDAFDDRLASMLEPAIEHDLDFLDEPSAMERLDWDAEEEDEAADEGPIELPRYQLHVKLHDEADIP